MKNLIKRQARAHIGDTLSDITPWVVEQGIKIQQIPSPTFQEMARAAYVQELFQAVGMQNIQQDHLHNVYGMIPGEDTNAPGLMLMAHTDTVFPEETDLTIRREGDLIYGPGLGDNSIGVAGMTGLAHWFNVRGVRPACNLWFVATSREEGLGNVDGARLAFDTLRSNIGMVINVEGLAYGYVYHAGIAVRRLHITAKTQGGHSWLHFGRASAIHAIMQLGAAITKITPAETPRTTYNIGLIEGGHSINSIATDAGMWLDLRSEETEPLTALENTVREEIARLSSDEVTFHVDVVGDRPMGRIDLNHPLLHGALAALEETGVRGSMQIGSTDGNIPLSHGVPTVTVGITRGGNAHRLDEYVEVPPVESGMRQLILLTLSTAQHQRNSQVQPQ